MKVLVTGHRGFIGTLVSKYFLARGDTVSGTDLLDGRPLQDVYLREQTVYDVIVHCARECDDLDAMVMDLGLLEWARRTKQPRIIYLSGSSVYPSTYKIKNYRLRENDIEIDQPRYPSSGDGRVKQLAEQAIDQARKGGVNVQVVRPFFVYGDDDKTGLHDFMGALVNRDDEVTLWGPSGQVNDYIHVDDVVHSIARLVNMPEFTGPINLCTGVATSVAEVAQMAYQVSNWTPNRTAHSRIAVVDHEVGDPIRQVMLWIPRVTLQDGLERMFLDLSYNLV